MSDKLALCRTFCSENNLELSEVAFIRDDLNDLPLLKEVGLSACPDNAPAYIKNAVNWALPICGGNGVYRVFVEKYLEQINQIDQVIKKDFK